MAQQYELFVEKFKRKKTSDDCYTPELVYNAVRDWAVEEYGLDAEKFVRPFWPDTDYEDFEYPDGCVVVDNPPFSIGSQILRFYLHHGIKFFLFAQQKTLLTFGNLDVCLIGTGAPITFENGATIGCSFITNLESSGVRSAPELQRRIKEANEKVQKAKKKELPKYTYPPEVLTFSTINTFSRYGIDFKVESDELHFTRGLDMQKASDKSIFGDGFLLSERAAAERAAAERAAAERANATKWELSDREWAIVKSLGRKTEEAAS